MWSFSGSASRRVMPSARGGSAAAASTKTFTSPSRGSAREFGDSTRPKSVLNQLRQRRRGTYCACGKSETVGYIAKAVGATPAGSPSRPLVLLIYVSLPAKLRYVSAVAAAALAVAAWGRAPRIQPYLRRRLRGPGRGFLPHQTDEVFTHTGDPVFPGADAIRAVSAGRFMLSD